MRKEDKEGIFPKQSPSQCLWGISLLTAFLGGSPPSFSGSNRSPGFAYRTTVHPRNSHTTHLLHCHFRVFCSKTEEPKVLETLTLQLEGPQKKKKHYIFRYLLLRFCSTVLLSVIISSCRGQFLSSGTRFSCFHTKYGCFRAL